MKNRIKKTISQVILIITLLSLVGGNFGNAILAYSRSASTETTTFSLEKEYFTQENTLVYTFCFSQEDLSFDTLFGYDLVMMKNTYSSGELGKPKLPMQSILVALPNDMKVTQVRILSIQEQPLHGTYKILPVQRPLSTDVSSNATLNVHPNKGIYYSPIPYPSRFVTLGEQTDLAGQSIIPINIYPVCYMPLQKKLIFIQSISFVIEGINGYICNDYLPQRISENGRMMYEQMIKGMVINPEDVELRKSLDPRPLGVPPGDYDYVIITQESWVSAFQSLADWKTQKGVPATIVTTNWIYNSGGYSGSNVEKIRAFVQDAYSTWGTTYVLIGGDNDVVPCHYKTFSGVDNDPVPNDVYYADFDSDWICEVNIGRASVTGPGTGTGKIGNFINKILTYETDPPMSDYAMRAALFGFDLHYTTPAEDCKIFINDSYIPSSWTVTTVYDSQTGNHRTNVIDAINAGYNLINHADHSNNDCMGTGYVNHNWLIYNSDMDDLTNGEKQSILYSMGCDPAAFDVSNCIGEHFVRNNNGGGIAFIGNSRYGWYNYGHTDTLSMEYDIHFFKSLFVESYYNIGAAFSDHKNDVIQSHSNDNYYKYIYTELTLLGDPELPIWTYNPSSLIVTHPLYIPLESSSFTVHVEKNNGDDVSNAYVCLWKEDEIYQRGYTNFTGEITFTVNPNSTGIMTVTVTKHNYIPSESTIQVIVGNLPPNEPSSPIPTNNANDVLLTTDLSWVGGDPNPEDTVTYDIYFGTSDSPPKVVSNQSATNYDPGTLNYDTTYHWKIIAWDNYDLSTTGPLWTFTTLDNTPPLFGTPTPANGSTWNPLSFTWSIPITDLEGDLFSWTIQCSNGQESSGSEASNGTKSLSLTGLSYSVTYKVWVNATDTTGSGEYNRGWYTFSTQMDNTPPTTTISFNGTMGNHNWYTSSVYVILNATDNESGINQIFYKINNDSWLNYLNPVELSEDGGHSISFYSTDNAGNIESIQTANLSIDHTLPDIILTKEEINIFEVIFTADVDDVTSGVERVEFSIDGQIQSNDSSYPYEWTWNGFGEDIVTATVFDKAGNSQSQSLSTAYSDITQELFSQQTPVFILKYQMSS